MMDPPTTSSNSFQHQLSTVREDSQEDQIYRTIYESFHEDDDQQSDKSDFDIIESLIDPNESNEGI